MRKVLLSALLGSALLSTSCKSLGVRVHAPPTYTGNVPSDTYYEELAAETTEMATAGEIPADPHEAYLLAKQEIDDRGIEIVPKAEGYEQWDKFTTTFPTKIFVAKGWDEYTEDRKAVILWHELVHVREYDRHTPLLMGLMYVTSEGRWALEVQAYRETFRVERKFGVPEDRIRENMDVAAEKLYEEYELGTMPRDYAIGKAIEIWLLDVPGA